MLFIIENDIVESDDHFFLQCFENLLLGYIEGNHLLFIKPNVVDLISEKYIEKMDSRTKRHFFYFQEQFMSESKMVYGLVNYAVKIIPNSIKENVYKSPTHDIALLHTSNFLSSATIQKIVLLVENQDDGDIYKIFAQDYCKRVEVLLKVRLRIDNGGGSTICQIFKRKIDNNEELCLCILDSDKKFLTDTYGETAKKLIREVKNKMTPKVHIYLEDGCRELENMLPVKFYRDYYSSDPNKNTILDDLEKIDESLFHFFDMKNGIKHFDMRKVNAWANIPWQSMLNRTENPTCDQNSFCSKRTNCKSIIIKGFGTRILQDYLDYIQNNSVTSNKQCLDMKQNLMQSARLNVGQLLFSWGCGQDRSIANI